MTIQTGTRFKHALKSDLLGFSDRFEYTFNAFIHYFVRLTNPRGSNFVFTRKVPLAFLNAGINQCLLWVLLNTLCESVQIVFFNKIFSHALFQNQSVLLHLVIFAKLYPFGLFARAGSALTGSHTQNLENSGF